MAPSEPAPALSRAQWRLVLVIAAVQFVNVLDFVIVMPLGPEFARALGVEASRLGWVNGAYTGAACVAGLLGSLFLDRFDRRTALAVALAGLGVGTAAGGVAVDLPTLLLARVVAGAFGGPATSLAFSIIADRVPPEVRGRAMGTVMGAFSVASVLGVPAGLWLAEVFSWRAPFFAVAGVGLAVGALALVALPPLTGHLAQAVRPVPLRALLRQPLVRWSYAMTAAVMTAGFVLIPNVPAYLQLNLGLPRAHFKYAYAAGGVASLLATQLGGRLVDRFGSFRVGTAGVGAAVAVIFTCFFLPWSAAPTWAVMGGFVAFLFALGVRNVAYNTLASKVPEASVRARFQSLQSAVQHGASASAAVLSAGLLGTAGAGGAPAALVGMPRLALVSMGLSAIIPVLLAVVERGVQRARAG